MPNSGGEKPAQNYTAAPLTGKGDADAVPMLIRVQLTVMTRGLQASPHAVDWPA